MGAGVTTKMGTDLSQTPVGRKEDGAARERWDDWAKPDWISEEETQAEEATKEIGTASSVKGDTLVMDERYEHT